MRDKVAGKRPDEGLCSYPTEISARQMVASRARACKARATHSWKGPVLRGSADAGEHALEVLGDSCGN